MTSPAPTTPALDREGTHSASGVQNLRSVHAFVTVAETRSFRAAAVRLRVSPSTVSKLVRSIEADLRTPLLHRTTRQVELTSAGARALEPARALIAQQRALTRAVQGRRKGVRGDLTAGRE